MTGMSGNSESEETEEEKKQRECTAHIPVFDLEEYNKTPNMSSFEVKEKWPRFFGKCAECGYYGIAYASFEHYIAGDW